MSFNTPQLLILEDPAFYTSKFNQTLEPVKAMLIHKRDSLEHSDWLKFVNKTQMGIIKHPDQYLDQPLPEKGLLTSVINLIFEDFLRGANS